MKNSNLKNKLGKKMGMLAVLISMLVGAVPSMASDVPDNLLSTSTPMHQCDVYGYYGGIKLGPGESCEGTFSPNTNTGAQFNFSGKDYLLVKAECRIEITSPTTYEHYNVDRSASLSNLKGKYTIITGAGHPSGCKITLEGVKG